MVELEEAITRTVVGPEKRSRVVTEEDKRITAYHEGGHALVAKKLPGTDPVHKVSIIPRGMALGITMQLPTDDRHNYSSDFLHNNLAVLMGGRVAEELVLHQMTTGAGNDIERATAMARKMVCSWGMSEALGPLSYGERDDEIFLGKDLVHHRNFSEETSRQIDAEVRRIVEEAYSKASSILEGNLDALESIAKALLERETITGDEIDKLLRGETLPPPEIPVPGTTSGETGGDGASGGGSAAAGTDTATAASSKGAASATDATDEFTLEPDDEHGR